MSNKYLFLFHTTLGVIQLKKKLQIDKIDFRVIDAPRALTAECSLAIEFCLENDNFHSFISEHVRAIYQYDNHTPVMKWIDDN